MSRRRLLRLPLARPPGRRFRLTLMPGICAGLVYLTLFGFAGISTLIGARRGLVNGVVVAYLVASGMVMLLPIGAAAVSLAGEQSGGTMDALLLTPLDRASLAWGRYWNLALPWLRFMLWVSPVYLALIFTDAYEDLMRGSKSALAATLMAAGPKPLCGLIFAIDWGGSPDFTASGLIILPLRVLRDALSLLLSVALAYYISARMRTAGRALLVCYLVIPGLLATVFCGPEWIIAAIGPAPEIWGGRGLTQAQAGPVYAALAPLGVLLEILAIRALVGRVARNFDAYALGEKPDRAPPVRERIRPSLLRLLTVPIVTGPAGKGQGRSEGEAPK